MDLKDLISSNEIIYKLKSSTKDGVFSELLEKLVESGKVKNKMAALHNLLEREGKLSTGMEGGLAIPHAKTDAVDKLIVAFGLHHAGLEYDSLDGKPAHFIFLVLSPPDTSGPHIQALASIARSLKDEQVRDALKKTNSEEEIIEILT